jgi:hypothetical protein
VYNSNVWKNHNKDGGILSIKPEIR